MTIWLRHHRMAALGVLLLAVVLAACASIAFGARVVSLAEIVQGLRDGGDGAGLGAVAVTERLPRTATALVVGAALGVSGALMQALTRNPIADPGILGINTGASLAMVAAIAFAGITTLPQYLWTALIGAGLTAVFVYLVGSLGPGGATPVKLALAGVATTAALSSLISAVMLPRAAALTDFRFWQVGSLGRGTWQSLVTVAPFLLVGALLALVVASPLNSLALGDEMAVGLGVHVARTRVLAAAGGVVLAATTTALAGPIGFVGLMVPHAVRMVIGADNRWVLPASALGGAALLTAADVVGRVIARPAEVSVGVVTAFIGAPVLILIARGTKVGQL
ncbi:MAG: iron ABC transporter permease [Actinomyces urogenitalis]|uniref:FecCD family ABC transporter permease n=1 Tax=Actinomyces urogenitalis TaxID=103621 RepID=UPI00242AC07F|nr:iron ABC transporter permease [Actinomyces urogenitalis]MCI7456392.1 iron ABC transporter permease [Actinomyces urogenitalis]MDY3677619.1 iron ABC transporter permease [Actinomyces urogenitalis]